MHKQKSMFFFLLQTEYGDIFKVTLDHDSDRVKELKIKYFDTIPVTSSLCVLKSGFLFAASEFGNHALYKFQEIGDEPDVESSSATLMETEDGYQPVRDENQLYIFADDSVPRCLTASCHIDFDTMAGADKFGNICFVRLPQDVSDEIEDDPTGGKIKWEQGKLIGAPNNVEETVQFHVGDVVTCLQKASLIPSSGECLIYGTVMGSLGALLAFTSRD
ncbi:hypothetical protein C3L33_17738, partial [Rhododendron williamsianum]